MLEPINKKWSEVFVVNNSTFEYKFIGKNKDIPIIIARDILKYPDKVREFVSNGYWWINEKSEDFARPGKSFMFGDGNENLCMDPIMHYVQILFGVTKVNVAGLTSNCNNGNMDVLNPHSIYPHVDNIIDGLPSEFDSNESETLEGRRNLIEDIQLDPIVAFNINITDSDKVNTGFWSFDNKKSLLEFTHNDYINQLVYDEELYQKGVSENMSKWSLIDDCDHYKLNDIVNLEYNSLILYPSHYFHNLYLKPEWFTDSDRITVTGFFEIDPEDMSFKSEEFDRVYNLWESFGLNKICNLRQL